MNDTLLYKVALSMIPGIGGVLARNLVSYIGSIEGIFREKNSALTKIPGIGEGNARRITEANVMDQAARELEFIAQNDIRTYFYLDENYPARFSRCSDAPVIFYLKGNADLDTPRIISIVGTRNATDYGRQMCEELIRDLSEKGHRFLVVSGLAYGIDIYAHKSSLKYNIPTVGIVGHGLDMLYPSSHSRVAGSMIENGGLLTDFPSKTKIDPGNFIRRNRLIAGLADATIVVESGIRGGALITADIASSYDRDVFAFPGKSNDAYSKGCNRLIKTNVAAMIENAVDFEYLMGWETSSPKSKAVQQQLFLDITDEEKMVVDLLKQHDRSFIDNISRDAGMPVNKISSMLLNLEFKGVVEALPGKMYRLR
jgi:DNA processing protein